MPKTVVLARSRRGLFLARFSGVLTFLVVRKLSCEKLAKRDARSLRNFTVAEKQWGGVHNAGSLALVALYGAREISGQTMHHHVILHI